MGKIRIKTLGLDEVEKAEKEKAKVRRSEKKAREVAKQPSVTTEEVPSQKADKAIVKKTRGKSHVRARGKNYLEAKTKIKKENKYQVIEAVKLLKNIKYAGFDETVELHLNLTEAGIKGEVSLPKTFGKATRVAVATEEVLKNIDSGKIEFDVLIAAPSFMPRLVKYAKLLGPKGLMPSPKAGTVTDKPEEAIKKFTSGVIRFKSEAKAPLLHQAVGKLSFSDKDLEANISAFLSAVAKKNIEAVFLKSTMSPAIRIDLSSV